MSKRRLAKLGLAGALSTLYGAAVVHSYKKPAPGQKPWKIAAVAAGFSSVTILIAVL